MKLKITIDGHTYDVEVADAEQIEGLEPSGVPPIQSSVLPTVFKPGVASDFDESKVCRSPLAGVISHLKVGVGQSVKAAEVLLVLDAMKMEIKVAAQSAGTIRSIEVAPGDAVKPNQVLISFE